MAIDVPMPKLGLTMEEAMIIEWLVADGSVVAADQPILRIETDKTETEVGAPGSGRLHQIGRAGDVFRCGVRIGLLLGEGEAAPAADSAPAAPSASALAAPSASVARVGLAPPTASAPAPAQVPGGRVVASPYARAVAAERGVQIETVRGTGPGGRIVAADVLEARASAVGASVAGVGVTGRNVSGFTAPPPSGTFAVATVAARQLADLLGVDLASVPVDPAEQRVTRDSVAWYVRTLLQQLASPTSAPAASAPSAPLLQEPTGLVRLSGMRGTIAKRMHASLQEMAQLTLSMDADMTEVLADRAARKEQGVAPSITDYIVAATARALLHHPGMNAQVVDGAIALLPEVHVGLAVAVPNGLMVPVVRDTAHRDLTDLAAETTRVAAAARSGSLSPGDLEGGTFSVSALGAYGVDVFTPVINPPNAGILGVGRLRDELVLEGGVVKTVKRLTLSLTWDHRVVDGVPAAEFCRTIVELLAEPAKLD
jgi:pyruvate dehydrogenase E2 component (dihydrolipoamide acetyltransferase)